MEIRTCKKCGFILGTRPNLKDVDGVCLACINHEHKKDIDYKEKQKWLTEYIAQNKIPGAKWDCVVGVSGGKDSCAIVKRLIENHNIKNPLLIHVTDEFTHSEAGNYNMDNLAERFNLDTLTLRCQPKTFIEQTKKDFFESCHPLKWIEYQLYQMPLQIARDFNIPLVFYGEDSAFEYGEITEPRTFHPDSDDKTKLIFLGSIYPYSMSDSLEQAEAMGFKGLDEFDDWRRFGVDGDPSQIDSIGYMTHHWAKFLKFGFQRISDITCRMVREGMMTKEQATQLIADRDYLCDPSSKRDFCKTIGITEQEFNEVADKFANRDLLVKDANGNWRRKDLFTECK